MCLAVNVREVLCQRSIQQHLVALHWSMLIKVSRSHHAVFSNGVVCDWTIFQLWNQIAVYIHIFHFHCVTLSFCKPSEKERLLYGKFSAPPFFLFQMVYL